MEKHTGIVTTKAVRDQAFKLTPHYHEGGAEAFYNHGYFDGLRENLDLSVSMESALKGKGKKITDAQISYIAQYRMGYERGLRASEKLATRFRVSRTGSTRG